MEELFFKPSVEDTFEKRYRLLSAEQSLLYKEEDFNDFSDFSDFSSLASSAPFCRRKLGEEECNCCLCEWPNTPVGDGGSAAGMPKEPDNLSQNIEEGSMDDNTDGQVIPDTPNIEENKDEVSGDEEDDRKNTDNEAGDPIHMSTPHPAAVDPASTARKSEYAEDEEDDVKRLTADSQRYLRQMMQARGKRPASRAPLDVLSESRENPQSSWQDIDVRPKVRDTPSNTQDSAYATWGSKSSTRGLSGLSNPGTWRSSDRSSGLSLFGSQERDSRRRLSSEVRHSDPPTDQGLPPESVDQIMGVVRGVMRDELAGVNTRLNQDEEVIRELQRCVEVAPHAAQVAALGKDITHLDQDIRDIPMRMHEQSEAICGYLKGVIKDEVTPLKRQVEEFDHKTQQLCREIERSRPRERVEFPRPPAIPTPLLLSESRRSQPPSRERRYYDEAAGTRSDSVGARSVFAAKITVPPPGVFKGGPSDDYDAWKEKLDHYFDNTEMPVANRAKYIPTLLEGLAYLTYSKMTPEEKKRPDEILYRLEKEYGPQARATLLHTQMTSCKQAYGESPGDYMERLLKPLRMTRSDMNTAGIGTYVNGLIPELRDKMNGSYDTINAAATHAENQWYFHGLNHLKGPVNQAKEIQDMSNKLDECMRMFNKGVHAIEAAPNVVQPPTYGVWEAQAPVPPAPPANQPRFRGGGGPRNNNRRNVVCYNCGGRGHVRAQCTSPQNDQGQRPQKLPGPRNDALTRWCGRCQAEHEFGQHLDTNPPNNRGGGAGGPGPSLN